MQTTLLAYVVIEFFFAIEGFLRKGNEAKRLNTGKFDRKSTRVLGAAFVITLLVLLSAPVLNYFQMGRFVHGKFIGWIGIVICWPMALLITPEPLKLVTVLTTGNAGLIAVAKSLLEAAEILYLAKGEGLQDLEALGRIGTGFNPVFGPVQIQVAEADAEEARRLLQDLEKHDATS